MTELPVRPEVVALYLDTITSDEDSDEMRWIPPEMWRRRSTGAYLSSEDRKLLESMTVAESVMGAAVAQAHADQAAAEARAAGAGQ